MRWVSDVPADEVIPEHAHDSDGEVDVSDIFCATCKETHSTDDNDLVLCDGPCNRCACYVLLLTGGFSRPARSLGLLVERAD